MYQHSRHKKCANCINFTVGITRSKVIWYQPLPEKQYVTHTYLSIYIHRHTHTHTHAQIYVCVYIYSNINLYAYIYIYICVFSLGSSTQGWNHINYNRLSWGFWLRKWSLKKTGVLVDTGNRRNPPNTSAAIGTIPKEKKQNLGFDRRENHKKYLSYRRVLYNCTHTNISI